VICMAIAPLLAWAYHRPELFLLTAVLSFTIFTTAFLDLPAALPYREMRFVRRNVLTSIGPVATFVVTIPTAYMGWGVWSLVAGALAGFLAAALALAVVGPMRPRIMWDRALARRYLSFGWPLWLGGLADLAGGWGAVVVVSATIGVAGLGFFQLAQNLAARALQVDSIVSDALFPALCAIQGAEERLRRAFVISNRLSMLWAAPVGLGLFLFASPAVHLLLGPKWGPSVLLVQAEGAAVVVTAIGYNWRVFYSAHGNTRPSLVVSVVSLVWLVAVVYPLMELFELRGAAASLIVLAIGSYVIRDRYLRRLLGPISLVGIVWRELAAAGLAALAIGGLRLAGWEIHGIAGLIGQGLAYGLLCAAALLITSRSLMLETWATIRGGRGPATAATATAAAAPSANGRTGTPMPQPMAFPLGVAADPAGRCIWVTTRDWPALGRLDVDTGEWTWTELPPFPHIPTPDGQGGCWTALTRASALAHVDAAGQVTQVALPRTKELLVSARHAGAIWVVDGRQQCLWRVDETSRDVTSVALPEDFRRPDYVAPAPDGTLWVADTHAPVLAIVDPVSMTAVGRAAPHTTRALLADPDGGGMWLGSSSQRVLTLVGLDGEVLLGADLPSVPFGVTPLADGRLIATLHTDDGLAVIDPERGGVEVVDLPGASQPMGCAVFDGRCFVALATASELLELPVPPAVNAGAAPARMPLPPM